MSKKVGIIGGGSWGTAIAKIIGSNLQQNPSGEFDSKKVTMYVYEEVLDQSFGPDNGKKLTTVINTKHENVKYLKGHKLPDNVVADSDLISVAKNSDYLIFVLPHQYINRAVDSMVGNIKPTATGISLVKGLYTPEPNSIALLSSAIRQKLKIPIGVLMGANVANEVADGSFCETTIAFDDLKHGMVYKKLMETKDFRVSVIKDVTNTELCGALKNIVAFGVGLCFGSLGVEKTNAAAAVVRLGLWEMIRFVENFFPGGSRETFFHSCGIADLITSSLGGRNRKVGEELAKSPDKTLEEVAKTILNGQELQGPSTSEAVVAFLKNKRKEADFPLFVAVYKICKKELRPNQLIDAIRNHPEYSRTPEGKVTSS